MIKSKIFGDLFVTVYATEDVIPYLYIFIYHIEYFLEKYGNLKYYANYAIKGYHKYGKHIVCFSTSGFDTQNKSKTLSVQELERTFRDMRQQVKNNLDSGPIEEKPILQPLG